MTIEIQVLILPSLKEMEEIGRTELKQKIQKLYSSIDKPKEFQINLTKLFTENTGICLLSLLPKDLTYQQRLDFLEEFIIKLKMDITNVFDFLYKDKELIE